MGKVRGQTIDFRLSAAGRFNGFLVESPVGRLGVVGAVQPDPSEQDVELVVVVPRGDTRVFVPLGAVKAIEARRRALTVEGPAAVAVTEPLRSRIAAARVRLQRTSAATGDAAA